MPLPQEVADEMAPDEAVTTGDQDTHGPEDTGGCCPPPSPSAGGPVFMKFPALSRPGRRSGGPCRYPVRALPEVAGSSCCKQWPPDGNTCGPVHLGIASRFEGSSLDLFAKAREYDRAKVLIESGLYPYFRAISESEGGRRVRIDGRELVMAGSNNYLGLTHDPRVRQAAKQAVDDFGSGCTGSRFLNGTLTLHKDLEARLAKWLRKEACITSATGFQTNLGAIECLASKHDVIFGDRDNHASLIDGCRLAYAKLMKYGHNDMAELELKLQTVPVPEKGGRLIVTDGVFSMLGDLAPVPEIVELAKKYEARVMVDDAHAVGVLGDGGRGTSEHFGVHDEVDLIVGTFSKSFACVGGFIAGPADVIDYVQHMSRSVIFSASMTPSNVATVSACLDIIENEPERRTQLWANVAKMRDGLRELGFDLIEGGGPILSVVIGEEIATLEFNRLLVEEGVFVNAVLSPAVPDGMCLLRTSYMATHTEEDLEMILSAFRRVADRMRIAR